MSTHSHRTLLQSIRIIFYAQLSTLCIIGAVIYLLIENEMVGDGNLGMAVQLQPVIIVAVPLMLGAGYFLFKHFMKQISPSQTLLEKLRHYLRASIIRIAFFEFTGISLAVFALVTGEVLLLAALPVIVFLVLFLRPTVNSIAEDLKLSMEERDELSHPNVLLK